MGERVWELAGSYCGHVFSRCLACRFHVQLNALMLLERGKDGSHVVDRRIAFNTQHPLYAFWLLADILRQGLKSNGREHVVANERFGRLNVVFSDEFKRFADQSGSKFWIR